MTQPTRKLLDHMAVLRNEYSPNTIIKACMELWPESVVGVLNDALTNSRQGNRVPTPESMPGTTKSPYEMDPDYMAKTDDLDAQRWAKAFAERFFDGDSHLTPADTEDVLMGYFANVIEAAKRVGRREAGDDPVRDFLTGAQSELKRKDAEAPIHSADVYSPTHLSFRLDHDPMSLTARRLVGPYGVFRNAINLFLRRNAEYGDESNVLGYKGQYADINRKMIKLKRYLWDDVPVPDGGESIGTIAMELIGHLALLVDEYERNEEVKENRR